MTRGTWQDACVNLGFPQLPHGRRRMSSSRLGVSLFSSALPAPRSFSHGDGSRHCRCHEGHQIAQLVLGRLGGRAGLILCPRTRAGGTEDSSPSFRCPLLMQTSVWMVRRIDANSDGRISLKELETVRISDAVSRFSQRKRCPKSSGTRLWRARQCRPLPGPCGRAMCFSCGQNSATAASTKAEGHGQLGRRRLRACGAGRDCNCNWMANMPTQTSVDVI